MRIERLEYQDRGANWLLTATDFHPDLTLFVGRSAADKWQLLAAIDTLARFALGDLPEELWGVAWDLRFTTEAGRYDWQGEVSGRGISLWEGLRKENFLNLLPRGMRRGQKPVVLRETLALNDRVLIERRGRALRLDGRPVAACSPSTSAMSLLRGEEAVQPAADGFVGVVFGEDSGDTLGTLAKPLQELCAGYPSLHAVRQSDLPTYYKLAVVHENAPDAFQAIVRSIRERLPRVEDVGFDRVDRSRYTDVPALRVLEKGTDHWLPASKLSTDLLRAVLNLAAVALWPDGAVILIDEFETTLGVHCLEPVLAAAADAGRNLQFILTSNDSEVIRRVSRDRRKIIIWQGAVVSIDDAPEFESAQAHTTGVTTAPGVTERWRRVREKTGITRSRGTPGGADSR
jgi:hypothetical protein